MINSPFKMYLLVLAATLPTLLGSNSHTAAPAKTAHSQILVGDVVNNCKGATCELAVVRAPLPGKTRVVSRHEVLDAIQSAGLAAPKQFIPNHRRVIRPGRVASSAELTSLIDEAVAKILPADIIVEKLGRISSVVVPAHGFSVEATWPGERTFRRRLSIPIKLISDEVSFRTLQISTTLVYQTQVPIAVRDIERGSIIDESSFIWSMRRLKSKPEQLVTTEHNLVGHRLNRFVRAGETFRSRDLEAVPVVLRGGRLFLESKYGLVSVKVHGNARQDGAVGDKIRVVIQPAGRLVWAQVLGPGQAVVVQ